MNCINPAFAHEVSHIELGGLSFRDVLNILEKLQADIVAANVVKFNLQRGTFDRMELLMLLCSSLLGASGKY